MKTRFAAVLLAFYGVVLLSFSYFAVNRRKQHSHNVKSLGQPQQVLTRSLSPSTLNSAVELIETDEEKKYWDQWLPLSISRNHTFLKSKKLQTFNLGIQQQVSSFTVDIWSNNGLGDYLWVHILHGRLHPKEDRAYFYGEKLINGTKFRYKSGVNIDITFLPDSTDNVILILNGRDNNTIATSLQWLNDLPNFPSIQNVGLMLIGSEKCDNDWLVPFIKTANKTAFRFVFVVYDTPLVDDVKVYQFPLGVATYRGFPLPMFPDVAVPGRRQYMCNFIGTVYPNSSRETLAKMLDKVNMNGWCYVATRSKWTPEETDETLRSYVKVLKSSDLTLCPIGYNSESYRIYEAMSVGSIPVVEDQAAPGTCDTPYRLLKKYKAPVIYVKHWSELSHLLEQELHMSIKDKESRRFSVMAWYKSFKDLIASHFLSTVVQKFTAYA